MIFPAPIPSSNFIPHRKKLISWVGHNESMHNIGHPKTYSCLGILNLWHLLEDEKGWVKSISLHIDATRDRPNHQCSLCHGSAYLAWEPKKNFQKTVYFTIPAYGGKCPCSLAPVYIIGCHHIFHISCLIMWLERHPKNIPKCPCCHSPLAVVNNDSTKKLIY